MLSETQIVDIWQVSIQKQNVQSFTLRSFIAMVTILYLSMYSRKNTSATILIIH
ncbi:hypothetical protein KPC81_05098 [Klebsiella pneumoniae]|nr:hypothetical protein [Klebsiella pneumoniae]MCB8868239.1 hypothetical protein [Klebsiella pneumoniae]